MKIPLIPVKEDASDRFITVFLSGLPQDKRNFRCNNCGWVCFQYQNDVGLMMEDGIKPYTESPVEVRCRRCNLTYRVIM